MWLASTYILWQVTNYAKYILIKKYQNNCAIQNYIMFMNKQCTRMHVCQRQFALVLGKQCIFNYNVYSFSCQLCKIFIDILLFSCYSILIIIVFVFVFCLMIYGN